MYIVTPANISIVKSKLESYLSNGSHSTLVNVASQQFMLTDLSSLSKLITYLQDDCLNRNIINWVFCADIPLGK